MTPATTELRDGYAARFKEAAGAAGEDPEVYPLLFALALALSGSESPSTHPVSLGVAGSQGSGKTTMTHLLAAILRDCFDLRVAILSLDDFYLPREDREQLARAVHPLLATRGVPGTHNYQLMAGAVDQLKAGGRVEVPVFDKAVDDRAGDGVAVGPVDVILCEGWCWGARPEPPEQLAEPVNDLEASEDPGGTWRRYVNDQLLAYPGLFETDASLYYLAPSFEAVFRWRLQQEEALARQRPGASGIMDASAIRRFISYYERITRWMMQTRPQEADICVALGEDHRIRQIVRNG